VGLNPMARLKIAEAELHPICQFDLNREDGVVQWSRACPGRAVLV